MINGLTGPGQIELFTSNFLDRQRICFQPVDLVHPEPAPFAGAEAAEVEAADAHADELEDVVAHDRAHAADLALAALGEDELEPGGAAIGATLAGVAINCRFASIVDSSRLLFLHLQG